MARWFKVEGTTTVSGVVVTLSTPDWTNENPKRVPGWLPRWESFDFTDQPAEYRRMFLPTWFFHLTPAWG